MTERVETIMPLTYMRLITKAYLSPNAGIIGGIKLDLWHYPAISDFEGFIQNLILLFAIDMLSFIVNAGLLWKYCKINLMKSLQKLQNDFWFLMLVVESTLFLEVNHFVRNFGNCFRYIPLFFGGLFGSCPWKWYGSYPSIQLEQESQCG